MIIDLPDNFRYVETNRKYAEVKDGTLHIYGDVSCRKMFYDITYALKENDKCYYCGCKLTKKNSTLDHVYPQDIGGPTIPNNMVPACSSCNSEKSNMTEEQYKVYRWIEREKRSFYRTIVENKQEHNRKIGDYGLPEDWVKRVNTKKFTVRVLIDDKYKGKKYNRIKHYYNKYHHLPKPIVTDKNNFVLDGYTALMFAKERHLKKIPVIILKNVEVHL